MKQATRRFYKRERIKTKLKNKLKSSIDSFIYSVQSFKETEKYNARYGRNEPPVYKLILEKNNGT